MAGDEPVRPSLADAGTAALRWWFVVTPPRSGAYNMALDHALLRRAAVSGEAVLRLYAWSRPTVSLGRHQSALATYDRSRLCASGLGVVRRPTGGRAVLHDHEVTYSVTAPSDAQLEPGIGSHRRGARQFYAAINALLVDGLCRLGVNAAVALSGASPAGPQAAGPCFEAAADGEVVANGRKLVGSAQWRENGAVLQHGSILVADDQHQLVEFQRRGAKNAPRTCTLSELLGRAPAMSDVSAALFAAFGEAVQTAGGRAPLQWMIDTATRETADRLQAIYKSDEWTWRR